MKLSLIKEIEEKEPQIVQFCYKNYLVWPIIRQSIRKQVYNKVLLTKSKIRVNYFINLVINFLGNFLKFSIGKKSFKYTFFERWDRTPNSFFDMYTVGIRKFLNNSNVFLGPESFSKRSIDKDSLVNTNFIVLPYILFFLNKLNPFQKYKDNFFLKNLCINYGLNYKYILSDLVKFEIFYYYYLKKLKNYKISNLFIYCGYNITNLSLIKAANKLNINTYEIQHGNFTPNDFAYHFHHPENIEFDSFYSSCFLYFNDNYKKMLKLRTSYFRDKKLLLIGFPIVNLININDYIKSKYIRILFLPVSRLDNKSLFLLRKLHSISKINRNIKITIRFHPSYRNFDTFSFILKEFKGQIEYDSSDWNFSIINHDYFLGEYSTTLVEAEFIGKRVFLLKGEFMGEARQVMNNPMFIDNLDAMVFKEYKWDPKNILKLKRKNYEIIKKNF
jgi:hypothetical protein